MRYLKTAREVIANGWHLAIRATCNDEQYKVDDECRQSYEWDLENDCSTYHTTGELAGGTCGIGITTADVDSAEELAVKIEKAIVEFKKIGYGYHEVDGQLILIAGNSVNRDYQVDDGEIRIRNAWVQEIVG